MEKHIFLKKLVEHVFECDDISLSSRKNNLVNARKVFCVISNDNNLFNSKGDLMSYLNKDHATFSHYEKDVFNLIRTNYSFLEKYTLCYLSFRDYNSFEISKSKLSDLHYDMHKKFAKEHNEDTKNKVVFCSEPGCKDKVYQDGLCCSHYNINYRRKKFFKVRFKRLRDAYSKRGKKLLFDYNDFVSFCEKKELKYYVDKSFMILPIRKDKPATIDNLRVVWRDLTSDKYGKRKLSNTKLEK